jgi:hypothetical protein
VEPVTRQKFDISVGTSVAPGIIDVSLLARQVEPVFQLGADSYAYSFPLRLDEAVVLRDMLTDAIEHVEAGGHGGTEGEK